nr:MAG TPA: hypothetical protein [Caudoviricetes sp.]
MKLHYSVIYPLQYQSELKRSKWQCLLFRG